MARLRNETGYVLNVEALGRMVTPGEEFDGPVDEHGEHVHVAGCVIVDQPKPVKAKPAGKAAAGEDAP